MGKKSNGIKKTFSEVIKSDVLKIKKIVEQLLLDKNNYVIELNKFKDEKTILIKQLGNDIDSFDINIESKIISIKKMIIETEKNINEIDVKLYGFVNGQEEGLIWKKNRLIYEFKKSQFNDDENFTDYYEDYITELNRDLEIQIKKALFVQGVEINEFELSEMMVEVSGNIVERLEEIELGVDRIKIVEEEVSKVLIEKKFNKELIASDEQLKEIIEFRIEKRVKNEKELDEINFGDNRKKYFYINDLVIKVFQKYKEHFSDEIVASKLNGLDFQCPIDRGLIDRILNVIDPRFKILKINLENIDQSDKKESEIERTIKEKYPTKEIKIPILSTIVPNDKRTNTVENEIETSLKKIISTAQELIDENSKGVKAFLQEELEELIQKYKDESNLTYLSMIKRDFVKHYIWGYIDQLARYKNFEIFWNSVFQK